MRESRYSLRCVGEPRSNRHFGDGFVKFSLLLQNPTKHHMRPVVLWLECNCSPRLFGSVFLLTGKVIDGGDNPLPNAVVYVTDTRTRAVKTYIVGADGSYRFPALAANVDYEIYAQANGKTSDTKKMNQFDDRKVVNIVLKIDK